MEVVTTSYGSPDQMPWLGMYTKIELGYVENKQGFSCKRCDLKGQDCSQVDKNSEGDTPGRIEANTCCNLWEADRKRAKMTTPALLQLIADTANSIKPTTGDTHPKGFWS